MDKLVETRLERLWSPDAFERDNWVRAQADQLPPGSRVLDAGAGASKYQPIFAHCRYETQDFCQYQGPLVKYTRPINHVSDITQIPIPDGVLDAILCTEVFEHVTDPMAVLSEFARLLKPGGRLFLTAPMSSYLHMEPYHFYGGFTEYWYRYWLPRRGFKVDSLTPEGGPTRMAVAFLHAWQDEWQRWEAGRRGVARGLSWCLRKLVRLPLYRVLPFLPPRIDRHLGSTRVCVGWMVAATRE